MRKVELEKELSIVHDALASSINGVIITDMEGSIEYVNPAFVRMFNYNNKDDIIGRYAADIFAEQRISKFSDIEYIIDKGEGNIQEFSVYRNDGSIFPVEVSTSIVTDMNGTVTGKMASFIDITERKSIEEENKKLSSELLKSQEKERQRVAKDLHDGVGQTILAAKLFLIAYQKEPVKNKNKFNLGLQFIDQASNELREIYNDLYPSILKDHGLGKTIRWYAKNYLELNNIGTEINIDLPEKLSNDIEENLYRIIKELFSNIIKHSGAGSVLIELSENSRVIRLRVKDNGQGFDLDEIKKKDAGFGLSNIRQRVNDLGGSFNIYSTPEKGTEVLIEIREGNQHEENNYISG